MQKPSLFANFCASENGCSDAKYGVPVVVSCLFQFYINVLFYTTSILSFKVG